MISLKQFFCFLILLFCGNYFFAQLNLNHYDISRVSQDDGLSQGSNYFRFEDSKGFMWITANDALNRYDGSNVKVYNLNYYFKNYPNLQQGYGFAEDNKNLYIGSTRGLYQYDYEKDEFILIEIFKNSKTKTAIPIGFSQGKIWCFNEDFELATYDVASKKIEKITQLPIEPLISMHVYGSEGTTFFSKMPFIDNKNNLWFFSKTQILHYNTTTKKSTFPLSKDDTTIYSSHFDNIKNNLYIGTKNNLLIYNLTDFSKKTITEIDGEKLNTVFSIAQQKDILVLKLEGKFIISNNQFSEKTIIYENKRAYGFGFDKIGRLWFCDDGFGQAIYNFNGKILRSSEENRSEKFSIIKNFGVNSISEFPNGNILINNGLEHLTKKSKFIKHHIIQRFNHYSIKVNFDPHRNGNWVNIDNLSQYELKFLDDKNNLKSVFKIENTNNSRFQSMAVFKEFPPMLSFSNGIFWLNETAKNLEKIKTLPDKNGFYINKISGNRVAISYLNGDMILAQINPDKSVKVLQKILPGVQSFYLQEDEKANQFWVGTNEGVFLLDKNFKILKKFDSNNGLAGTYIYGILIDNDGNAWCSHQRGLSSIEKNSFRIINYDKEDGIQHWDFNNRAFLKTRDGTLYFGGVNGFNYFKPPLKIQSHYQPEIYFDEILINNKRIEAKNGFNSVEKLALKNDENNINIKVFIKDLEFGKQRKLYYRITNHENKWTLISAKQSLIFNSLSPNHYKIEFAVYDKFSNQFSAIKKLEITISKAFYQTFLFWILVSGLFFGGIFALYGRWRFLKQKEFYQHELDLDNQRNKITADLHDDLGATLSSLQINSAIAQKLLDKDLSQTRKILQKIEAQAKHISENIGDIIWSLKPGKNEFMSLSTRIINSANEILGHTEIPFKIKVNPEIDLEIKDFTMRKNMVLICKEALNNIAKYSLATKVEVNLTKKNEEYHLEIFDNGIGFNPENKKGNGLQNMKKRTEEMHGKFEVSTNPGTFIKIIIPTIRD